MCIVCRAGPSSGGKDMIRNDIYHLKWCFHPVAVVGKIVHKKKIKKLYAWRETIHKTTKNTEHTK
jgi:hypothetical protein